jgi:hypothetical protein
MQNQEQQQNLNEEQLEVITGGTNSAVHKHYMELTDLLGTAPPQVRPVILDQYLKHIPLDVREPLHHIPEEPKLEKAAQTGWISENPNKRRRIG